MSKRSVLIRRKVRQHGMKHGIAKLVDVPTVFLKGNSDKIKAAVKACTK
ncbi:hypothetical protein UFOVP1537_19 [uncultured Caudovirales phage]|uniref:Uncharacterized protein n=2 Tax=root TaxID=1 RepID=A0A6J5PH77_9CAUD|nr:hypothetical protein UFOVP825_37 [uncultured Caudovirales phage]CAB4171220.1 hypothetical protein UFOVP915_19 [uncultured Caudovirales phage]CAB4177219.1 hypothetical protein UFOVP1000_36 [uncultured Caudovirales phage]CAB4182611.1 hypothetical protein UFOVP1092_11 [uncultured Caudovirales phage]CAB4187400.1 hypothetical protein UFOVP1152_15 [uncultured Caudovirales phage]